MGREFNVAGCERAWPARERAIAARSQALHRERTAGEGSSMFSSSFVVRARMSGSERTAKNENAISRSRMAYSSGGRVAPRIVMSQR